MAFFFSSSVAGRVIALYPSPASATELLLLVGLIRTHWRGLSGGAEVWEQATRFFETLRKRSESAVACPMPDLSFQVESVAAVPFAAVSLLAFRLRIKNAVENQAIHTVALRCQIQIEVTRRQGDLIPARRSFGNNSSRRIGNRFT